MVHQRIQFRPALLGNVVFGLVHFGRFRECGIHSFQWFIFSYWLFANWTDFESCKNTRIVFPNVERGGVKEWRPKKSLLGQAHVHLRSIPTAPFDLAGRKPPAFTPP